jgi:hypothetical protein
MDNPTTDKTIRVFFMSKPTTGPRDRRSYLVKSPGEFYGTVRVTPADVGPFRSFRCDCGEILDCKHIYAVAIVDRAKFPQK